jgi:Transmembrane secretion effector
MLLCDAGRALAVASVVAAVATGHATVAQLVVVAFFERTLTIFFSPAESIALTRIVPADRLAEAVSRNDAREYTATLLGPPLGGALYGISRLAPFAADAVSYLISFTTISALRLNRGVGSTREARNLRREIREGLSFVWQQPFLRASLFQAGATNLVWASLTLAMIVVARRGGASSTEIGAMFALLAVGGVAGSVASSWILGRASPTVIVVGSVWWWAVVVSALAATTNPYVLGVGAGAAVFLTPPWNGTVVGLTMRLTPDAIRGRVQAVDGVISYGARPLGLVATGFLADSIGGRSVILILGLLTALVAVLSTLSPALRNAPAVLD